MAARSEVLTLPFLFAFETILIRARDQHLIELDELLEDCRIVPEKNWKFSPNDAKERGYWDDYMKAYEKTIRETATRHSPWYVVPADNKWFTRVVVAAAVIDALASMDLKYPKIDEKKKEALAAARVALIEEGDEAPTDEPGTDDAAGRGNPSIAV